MGSIEEVLDDLRLQEKPNILQTAKKHNVHRTTLSRRWNNVTGSKQAGYDQWSTDTGRGFEPMGQAGQAFSLGLSCQPAWLAPRPNIV
jgi:hypothetical protein